MRKVTYADPRKLRTMALDFENALDPSWAERLGIDPSRIKCGSPSASDLPMYARTSRTLEDVHEWLEFMSDAVLSVSDYQAEVQGMLDSLNTPCKEGASSAPSKDTKMFNDLSDVEHRQKCREYAIGFSGPFESQAHRIAIEWYRRPESGQDPDTLAVLIGAEIDARLLRERREMRTQLGEDILRRLGLSQR